jgi:hypothetical protein
MTAEHPPTPQPPHPDPIAALMAKLDPVAGDTVTEGQLQAAFLAARALGVVLQDDVLRAVILAARRQAIAEW